MITRKISHKILGIDPSTIANIAFLLVALFLVMIVRPAEIGLNTTLPPWQREEDILQQHNYCWHKPYSLFDIRINSIDKIIVCNEEVEYTDIKDNLIQFVFNKSEYSTNYNYPQTIFVLIYIDSGTSYAMYLNVYNEIKAAYKSIWDTAAQKKYNRFYHQLTKQEQNEILTAYPLIISEY